MSRARNHTAEQTDKVVETDSQVAYEAYAKARRTRRFRSRLVGFAVCVPLWLLSVVPVARESMEGREGANDLLVFLAVGAISIGVAAAIRGAYVLLRKRSFWSPWLFVIAAAVALAGYAVQNAGEDVPVAGAQALEASAE
jgi:cation transport ATPase